MAGKDAEMPSQQALSEDIQEIAKHLTTLRKDLEGLTGRIKRTINSSARKTLPATRSKRSRTPCGRIPCARLVSRLASASSSESYSGAEFSF